MTNGLCVSDTGLLAERAVVFNATAAGGDVPKGAVVGAGLRPSFERHWERAKAGPTRSGAGGSTTSKHKPAVRGGLRREATMESGGADRYEHGAQRTAHSAQPTVHSPQPTAHSPQLTAHCTRCTVHGGRWTVHPWCTTRPDTQLCASTLERDVRAG